VPDPHWCPVCDFGPGKSLQQVRSHVNSLSRVDGDDHDWTELAPVVREQHADQQETSETTENDQRAGQRETAGSGAENQSSDDGAASTEMATQDEYEEQYRDDDGNDDDAVSHAFGLWTPLDAVWKAGIYPALP